MKAQKYLDTFRGTKFENRISRYVILGLTLVVIILAFKSFVQKQTIVLIPPGLTQKGKLMPSNASSSIKEAWGTYFAVSLGNVTPNTADFTAHVISPHVSPSIYHHVMGLITSEAKVVKHQSITASFVPTDVFYVPSQKVVVVTGQFSLYGLNNQNQTFLKTYVMGVHVRNYKVTLTSLNTYKGSWKPPVAKSS